MALLVATDQPRRLLRRIYEAIDQGVVTTWAYDDDGDFTHTSEQWRGKLWLQPYASGNELVLTTIPSKSKAISTGGYAYYHGHFAQMLLMHFDDGFDEVTATASPARGDLIR